MQSGMLLNHCILYRDFTFSFPEAKPFEITNINKNYNAFIYFYIKDNKLNENIITFENAEAKLIELSASTEFIWIHILNKHIISLICDKFTLHHLVSKSFMDPLPRTTINFFDNGLMSTFTTFCKLPNIMNVIGSIKTYLYINSNLVISLEKRSYATDFDSQTNNNNDINNDTALDRQISNPTDSNKKIIGAKIIEDEQMSTTLDDQRGIAFTILANNLKKSYGPKFIEKYGANYLLYELCHIMIEVCVCIYLCQLIYIYL
jgi:hypothetical protein